MYRVKPTPPFPASKHLMNYYREEAKIIAVAVSEGILVVQE